MPGLRLVLLGFAVGAVVLVLVAGTIFQLMRDSFKSLHDAQKKQLSERGAAPPPPARRKEGQKKGAERYTPQRTRLRWYSPEIVAVLLLALAAGIWLARLAN